MSKHRLYCIQQDSDVRDKKINADIQPITYTGVQSSSVLSTMHYT